MLIAILLPIAIPLLTGFTDEYQTDTTTYTSQTLNGTTNKTVTLGDNQQITVTLNYPYVSGSEEINLTLIDASSNQKAANNTGATSIFIQWNVTTTAKYYINLHNNTIGTIPYNLTVQLVTFVNYDTSTETLVQTVIPIVAVISVMMMFLTKVKSE